MRRDNPFPGMNPWMQNVWSDLHARLIVRIADAVGGGLPDDLSARAEESVHLEGQGIEPQQGGVRRPDVSVVGRAEEWKHGQSPVARWPGAEGIGIPVLVTQQDVDLTPRWVEIRTAEGGVLITVIEVTSPHNKSVRGREAFERKIDDFLHGGVSVVEIDLVRGGLGARDSRMGEWPQEPSQIIVNRSWRMSCAEVYPCPLRERVPAFRVPLRVGEPDVALDLQPLLDECHLLGRYWQLRYSEPPAGPLSEEDLLWAREIAGEAGLIQG